MRIVYVFVYLLCEKKYFFQRKDRERPRHAPLQVVVTDPLKGLVVDRILAVLEAYRRVELLELSPDERGTVGGGGLAASVAGLIRCTVAVTNAT